jgi:hypothetical protein
VLTRFLLKFSLVKFDIIILGRDEKMKKSNKVLVFTLAMWGIVFLLLCFIGVILLPQLINNQTAAFEPIATLSSESLSETRVASRFQTEMAGGSFYTSTPRPTSKPIQPPTADLRSISQKYMDDCLQSTGLKYIIYGRGYRSSDKDKTRVSLTYQNDTGGTEQSNSYTPVCISQFNFQNGDFVYISAQLNDEYGVSVQCLILDNDRIVAQSKSSGKFTIASCSGEK